MLLNFDYLNILLSRAELEKAIRAQVAAEEKAHKIVEQLVLDEAVTEDYLTVSVSIFTGPYLVGGGGGGAGDGRVGSCPLEIQQL